jgi:hypothetical protein
VKPGFSCKDKPRSQKRDLGHQPFLRRAALYLDIWLLEKMGLATKVNARRV